jgi:hypothetical protein
MPDQPWCSPVGVHLIFVDPWSKEWGQPHREQGAGSISLINRIRIMPCLWPYRKEPRPTSGLRLFCLS